MVTLFYQTAIDHVYFYEIEFAKLIIRYLEHMAIAQGLGALYNGYLQRISDQNENLKKWLGIEGEHIKACMLLGYPNITYARTAPRREARVTIR